MRPVMILGLVKRMLKSRRSTCPSQLRSERLIETHPGGTSSPVIKEIIGRNIGGGKLGGGGGAPGGVGLRPKPVPGGVVGVGVGVGVGVAAETAPKYKKPARNSLLLEVDLPMAGSENALQS